MRSLDADIHAALLGAGLADVGTYRAAGVSESAPGTDVRVYVERGVQSLGEFGQVSSAQDQVTLLRADADPARGATIVADGWRYVLAERVSEDESTSTWVVRGEALP